MAESLQQLIDKTISLLNGAWTNRPKLGTVATLTLDGSSNVNQLVVEPVDGANSHAGPAVLEIDSKLLFASSWDSNSGVAQIPTWGNGFEGSSKLSLPLSSEKVTINPLWPRWFVGKHLIDAMNSLFPRLYGVAVTQLTSDVVSERYELPAEAEEIISINVEGFGPTFPRRQVKRYTFVPKNVDGKRYVNLQPIGLSGRPIIVTYRTRPVLPSSPTDTTWTWDDSLLPSTSADLPTLRAAYTLITSAELAKMQTYSVEQSDRNKFVQMSAGNSVSRRLEEMFNRRLSEEQDALQQANPVRPHMRYN